MTTMDSDSESQDSDDGRRFRFETTRKDSLVGVNSRKRGPASPVRSGTRRRSRSTDRGNRDRRNLDRSGEDHTKKSRANSDARRPSRDRDSKYSKEIGDSGRSGSRYRDGKDSKNCSNSSSNHKESKHSRESPSTSSRRDSKTRERDRRRSVERSIDRGYDDKHKYANKFPVRNKRNSRERSRERSRQGSKPKVFAEIVARSSRVETTINAVTTDRKISRKHSDAKSIKDVERELGKTNVDNESDSISRGSSRSSRPECKDLNLSDFDIVSDTEEHSSDDSISRKSTRDSTRTGLENSLVHDGESGMKKRVSKHTYERLLKRQAVKNRRNLEELHKVKAKNGERSAGTSDNNRTALSDFLLGKATPTTAIVRKLSENSVDREDLCSKEATNIRNNLTQETNASDSDNSGSDGSTYGPILPPKIDDVSSSTRGEKRDDNEITRSKEKIVSRVIGPTMPAHFRQTVVDTDAEDTFGPVLPPHLEPRKATHREPEDETTGLSLSTDNPSENEDPGVIERTESEADDDFTMGPLPSDHPALESDIVQRQLELRARRIKAELAACDEEDKNKREEWMIELPSAKTVNLGLGPRKFRVRAAPDMSDRSSWTDTPADKARKRIEKLENMALEPTVEQDRVISDANSEKEKSKKQQLSLLEMHQKKLQRKKKKEEREAKKIGKTAERRPFDRDVDLQANRFDDARKKSILSKARQLDDRFSRGKM